VFVDWRTIVRANAQLVGDLKAGWAALAAGDMDKLAGFYAEDMIFVLPGQEDVLAGRDAFRKALDGIGQALPSVSTSRTCVTVRVTVKS